MGFVRAMWVWRGRLVRIDRGVAWTFWVGENIMRGGGGGGDGRVVMVRKEVVTDTAATALHGGSGPPPPRSSTSKSPLVTSDLNTDSWMEIACAVFGNFLQCRHLLRLGRVEQIRNGQYK
jgi:hypothetical protein